MKNLRSTIRTSDQGSKVFLRTLLPDDVTPAYVKWLNDPEMTKYLESRHEDHTFESCLAYAENTYKSESDELFCIIYDNVHVGNVKIGNIHPIYFNGDVGIMIDKLYWGYGISKIAISLVEEIAFDQLKLHKLYAGAYKNNIASIRAFSHNGWQIVGEMKEHCIIDEVYINKIWMEKLNC